MSQEKDTDSRIALLLVFTLIGLIVTGVLWFGATTVLNRGKAQKEAVAALAPVSLTGAVISFHFAPGSDAVPDAQRTIEEMGASLLEKLRSGNLKATVLPFNGMTPATAAAAGLPERRAHNVHAQLLQLGVPAQHLALASVQMDPLSADAALAQRVEVVLQTPRPLVMASIPVPVPAPDVQQPSVSPAEAPPGERPYQEEPDGPGVMIEDGVVKFYFASSSSELAPGSDVALAEVIAAVAVGQRAIISGFTDPTGNAEINEKLAKERAFAVRDMLMRLGVPHERIELERPQSHTGTGSNAKARRVEVRLSH